MNGSSTQTFEAPTRGGRTRRWNDEAVSVAIAACATFMIGVFAFPVPDRVEQLSVANPSEYRIGVFVYPAAGGPGASLGLVEPGTTRVHRDVLDQGERWAFRFSSQGIEAGVVVLDRSALEAQGWEIGVPSDVIEALGSAQVPVPPVPSQRVP